MKKQFNEFEELSSREMKNHNGGSVYYPVSNYDGIYAIIEDSVNTFTDFFKQGYNKARKNGGNL